MPRRLQELREALGFSKYGLARESFDYGGGNWIDEGVALTRARRVRAEKCDRRGSSWNDTEPRTRRNAFVAALTMNPSFSLINALHTATSPWDGDSMMAERMDTRLPAG